MESQSDERSLERLREAYAENRLTLYVGAGVSVGNGLPNWQELVLAMYFSAIADERMSGWRPFPNYLYAIAEWHLERVREPLDITARRCRKYYEDKYPGAFVDHLRKTLYAGFASSVSTEEYYDMDADELRDANPTLDAVARLCEGGVVGGRGVRAVVTQNYDNLLEMALGEQRSEAIWKAGKLQPPKLPIYHVHGYVPVVGEGSTDQEIVFTEEQYHLAARDAYSWANLAQIQCMSSSVGLMVGLSLSDRNIRRLLDAVMTTPAGSENFALLRKPRWEPPGPGELGVIHEKALEYYHRFNQSGAKTALGERDRNEEILGILGQVELLDIKQQTDVLTQLGVRPIWYEEHYDIAGKIKSIMSS